MSKMPILVAVIVIALPSSGMALRLEDMNWSQRGANPAKTGSLPWKLGPSFKPDTSPVSIPEMIEGVATWGDQILVATQKGKLIAISKNRQMLWSATLPGKPVGTPAVAEKAVYVQTADGVLMKFDAIKGTKLIETKMNPKGTTDVTISGRYAIFGGENQVICFDVKARVRKWIFKASKPPQPVAVHGSLAFINHQDKLTCVKLFDGKILWETAASSGKIFVDNPTVGSSHVYIRTIDGKTHAFAMFSGKEAWVSDMVTVRPVTFDKGRIYAPTTSQVVCLDASTGRKIWASDTIRQPVWSQVAKLQNCLVVASKDSKVLVLNPDNGRQVSVIQVTRQVVVDFAVGNDYLVIPDNTWKVDKGNRLCIVFAAQ